MANAVETIGLTKVLQDKVVVNDVNLSIPEGSIYGIVGANGAGKTTLLRLMHGIMRPTSGELKLFGEIIPRDSAELRQRVGHVASDGQIYPSFRVQDLVRYAGGLYQRWDEPRCQRLLAALELPKRQLIRHLSLGMRMQLRLAIRLSAHPDVLLLDEPTNGLDPVVKRQFLQLILDEAVHDGSTIIIATHHLDDLERMADSLAVMYQGKVIASGVIDELKSRILTYQVVLPSEIPEEILHSNRILQTEQRGAVWTITVDDPDGAMEQLLRPLASHLEILPQNLEDVFTHLLRKEGYSREAILLA